MEGLDTIWEISVKVRSRAGDDRMEFGVHLPLIDFGGTPSGLDFLTEYTEAAESLGYTTLCANDHLVFPRPWLDGPIALASVMAKSGSMSLATTVSIPVVRGPVATAKTLGAIDLLSEGRLVVGVGPGSSARDYEAVGVSFEERWKRLDETVHVMRALWQQGSEAFKGEFYSTEEITLEPYPKQQPAPGIWIGSWGSAAGLRRVARIADGWLASGYNTTPQMFSEGHTRLGGFLRDAGKAPEEFPNAIATMFCFLTEDRNEADKVISEIVRPAINRPEEELHERLLIGSAEECAEKVAAYESAGAQKIYLWPVANEMEQLCLFAEKIKKSS